MPKFATVTVLWGTCWVPCMMHLKTEILNSGNTCVVFPQLLQIVQVSG